MQIVMEDEALATVKQEKPEMPRSPEVTVAKVYYRHIQLFFLFSEVGVYVIVLFF